MKQIKLYLPALMALLLGVFFAFSLYGFAPPHSGKGGELSGNEIRWVKGKRLSWKEFRGRPDRFTPADAMTESGIVFNWSCDWRGFDAEIYAIFDPDKSWVKRSFATAYLLKHEQAHFDITEIHARKMRKAFAEAGNACRLGRGGISRIAQRIYDESAAMQNKYDMETRHSKNERAQSEWERRIIKDLRSLEAWAE